MFKIVDAFYGAQGGSAYFCCADEERDSRRFSTKEEANAEIEYGRSHEVDFPRTSRKYRMRSQSGDKDRWGRRHDNLEVVPEDFRWCCNSDDNYWRWQVPEAFEFGDPVSTGDRTIFYVWYGLKPLGPISTDGRLWRIDEADHQGRHCVSAYHAAHTLLKGDARLK